MINYALIGKALLHPTQREILEAFDRNGSEPLSPKRLELEIGQPLGNISYHVNILAGVRKDSKFADRPLLELVDTVPRRGAVEHLYRLTRAGRVA